MTSPDRPPAWAIIMTILVILWVMSLMTALVGEAAGLW